MKQAITNNIVNKYSRVSILLYEINLFVISHMYIICPRNDL
ncbi:hypothetical protein PBCV1_a084aL [Paramecium bursaria Chlorella virus 1]|uniref:Uncharacterized protein n=1 Tax=Paramecium bursaria Chlorella virus 1 TaxID=10506 RepID=F8TTX2_PBCV1|nr:hypothetical protein PBCV1_a084aL [Paramecium bursaria Chlorella virus 1]AEI70033.1 hypothetical protein [Paramecium bursaria Chlorella virus 1]